VKARGVDRQKLRQRQRDRDRETERIETQVSEQHTHTHTHTHAHTQTSYRQYIFFKRLSDMRKEIAKKLAIGPIGAVKMLSLADLFANYHQFDENYDEPRMRQRQHGHKFYDNDAARRQLKLYFEDVLKISDIQLAEMPYAVQTCGRWRIEKKLNVKVNELERDELVDRLRTEIFYCGSPGKEHLLVMCAFWRAIS